MNIISSWTWQAYSFLWFGT